VLHLQGRGGSIKERRGETESKRKRGENRVLEEQMAGSILQFSTKQKLYGGGRNFKRGGGGKSKK